MTRLPIGQRRGVLDGGCQYRGQGPAVLAAFFLSASILSACGPQTGPGLEPPGALRSPTASASGPGAAFGNGNAAPATAVTPPAAADHGAAGSSATMPAMAQGAAGSGSPTTGSSNGFFGGGGSAAAPMASGAAGSGTAKACVALRTPVRLGLHLVVDESAAMVVPNDLWSPLGEALDAFVVSDQASGIELGVQFFQGGCDPSAYAQPSVPIAPAGGQQAALDAAMGARTHWPGAATTLALQGGLDQARAWTQSSKGNAGVLLISGSEPTACSGSAATAASAAASGLSGTPAVPTYVVALNAQASLDSIARSGGTGASIAVSNPASTQALLEAMQSVAARAGCEYALPAEAVQYVPDRVNLELTQGGATTTIARVADAQACDPAQGGWYYDDPQAPRRIIACQQTCAQVSKGGNVEIVFGCTTGVGP
jgi:hypothetical protein